MCLETLGWKPAKNLSSPQDSKQVLLRVKTGALRFCPDTEKPNNFVHSIWWMTNHDMFWPPWNKHLPATSARTCTSPQDHNRSNMEASRLNVSPRDKHVVEMQPKLDFLLTAL